jgi:hypothetical protein
MTPEPKTTDVQSLEAVPPGYGSGSLAVAPVWQQPGFAGLWGLATAKDSLKYWLQVKSFSSNTVVRWAFAWFFVMTSLNGFTAFNRTLFAGKMTESLAIVPFTTALLLLMVLVSSKERSQGTYFWVAWSFWIFGSLIGFVNPTNVTSENYRSVFQFIIKSWISLIGIPWMAFRVISPDKLPRYTKILVLSAGVGSIMCLLQIYNPDLFSYIRDNKTTSRGAGTWENSNGAGFVLMMALYLTRLISWRSRWVSWTIYLLLLAGLVGTFSRGALLGFVGGEVVYLMIVRNYKRICLGGLFMLLFLSTWVVIGMLVQNGTLPVKSIEMRDRLQTFSNIFQGKGAADIEASRAVLWRATIQDVVTQGNVVFGVGHAGLERASLKLAPHNEYIHYFAVGGLLGLLAYLGFLFTLFYIFWRCKDRSIRATLLSMFTGYALICMTGDGWFFFQMTGPYIAIYVMWAHYAKDYPGADKVKRLKNSLTNNLALSQQQFAQPRVAI